MSQKQPQWPRLQVLEDVLRRWQEGSDPRISVAVEGESVEARPIYSVTLTDPAVRDREKQHTLLSAMHTGGERSSAATLFSVIQWLLSGDSCAREVLRRQIVVCVPVVHPEGYEKGRLGSGQKARHGGIYAGWDINGVKDPEGVPEAAVIQSLLDRYQPELYADVHGISCDFPGQLMVESSAASPTRVCSRPYHQQIARMMDEAALEAGYPSDFQEDDCEILYWGPGIDEINNKLWPGRFRWAPGLYAYAKYHTLYVVMEITWPESGLARFKRLLQIGNERWETECDTGYPTRIVGATHPTGMVQMIAAYGQTAAQRRASRVELWRKHARITQVMIDPPVTGKNIAVLALSPVEREQWLEGRDPGNFADNLGGHPDVDVGYIREFLEDWPGGQNRSKAHFITRPVQVEDMPAEAADLPQNGIAFRLRIPFVKARLMDVRVNGYPIDESAEDGYTTWRARGFTFVQFNVPPAKTRRQGLFIVSCHYDPGETRPLWLSLPGDEHENASG